MNPITTAIVTAIATNLGQGVVKDAYEALKSAIKQKFGRDSEKVATSRKHFSYTLGVGLDKLKFCFILMDWEGDRSFPGAKFLDFSE